MMDKPSEDDQGLPDTQGATGCSEISDNSECQKPIWGHLFSLQDGFSSLDLIKKKYSFGRFSTCDVVYQGELPPSLLGTLSKVHFTIEKDEISQNVLLADQSFNGTFINEVLVGRGETAALKTNDQISLVLPAKKTYTFVGNGCGSHATSMPMEVTERYIVSRELGSGAFGQVCLVFDKETKARYALKTVQKLQPGTEQPIGCNEANLLMELNHPCIIKVVTTIDTTTTLHIVLELMDGGDLLARTREVERFHEAEAKFINYQIALAVDYIHAKNISHRDLKMENILLASKKEYPHVKLGDFGLSRTFGKSLMKTYCGTPAYIAPEVLSSRGKKYTKQVDIWSLGVIAYISLSGEHPFKMNKNAGNMPLEEQIIRGFYFFPKPCWEGISVQAIEVIKQMMNVKPEERLNITQVLAHSWLMNPTMKKKAHAMLRLPLKRPQPVNENVVPNRRKK